MIKKEKPWRTLATFIFAWIILSPCLIQAEENDLYSFEVEDFTKKTWEWKNEISATETLKFFNQDAAGFPLKFQNDEVQAEERKLQVVLDSRWDWDWSRLYLAGEASTFYSTIPGANQEDAFLREGYWQLSQWEPSVLEMGKRLLRWGKGYAFNPVAFLERPKSPEDPEASREGLWLVQGIWISGAFLGLDSSSVSSVFLPIRNDINEDYQAKVDHENVWGLKLYMLLGTTDIDFYWVDWEEKGQSDWGVDFASNLSSNFEIHGEYARKLETDKDGFQSLLGLRYLTENEITLIAEVYHDSLGLSKSESSERYQQIAELPPLKAKPLLSQLQQKKTISQDYGYAKASIKEPFDWLYLTPSVAWLGNLSDHSQNVISQLSYAPGNNWSMLASWQHQSGDANTQYGENLVHDKLELKGDYTF